LFAGIACARNELRTLVLEKQTYPIDKACGEGIMPSGVNNLRKLGVAPFLEKYPYHLFKGIRYVSAKGSVAEVYFAEGCVTRHLRTISKYCRFLSRHTEC